MTMTFGLRNRRRLDISEALLQLDLFGHPQELDLRAQLGTELEQLEQDTWWVSDGTYRAVAAAWLWNRTNLTVSDVAGDAVLRVFDRVPLLTDTEAQAINAIDRPGDVHPTWLLDEITATLVAIGSDTGILNELFYDAHRQFLSLPPEDRGYPFDDVGVLLPLRLETLFEEQPDGTWEVLLRVVPDEPSVLRDNPNLSQGEVDALHAFWSGLDNDHRPDTQLPSDAWLQSDPGRIAWERLANRVGARRAAWLIPEFPPQLAGDRFVVQVSDERIGEAEPNRVGGMPETLVVWIVTLDPAGNEQHQEIGALHPRSARLTLPLPKDDEAIEQHWLVSWSRAVRQFDDERDDDGVGMGVQITLPDGVSPGSIETLYVVGIGDEDPADHFAALANAGDLGIARLGVATNAVQGAPAQDLATDADAWREIAIQRLTDAPLPELARMSQRLLGDGGALAGENGVLPALPGIAALGGDGRDPEVEESHRFVRALWPVLWGHFLRDHWQLQDNAHWLSYWATIWLYPEGPLSPIRVGEQPYGVIPTTALSEWEAWPDDLAEFQGVEAHLARFMTHKRDLWARAAHGLPTATNATTADLIDLIGRDGVSAGYGYQSFIPSDLLASLFSDPSAVPQRVAELYDVSTSLMQNDLPGIPGPFRHYVAIGPERPLNLSLIEASRLAPNLSLEEMMHLLLGDEVGDVGLHNYFIESLRGILPDSLLIRLMMHSVIVSQGFCAQSANGTFAPLIDNVWWDDSAEETPLRWWRMMFFELNAAENAVEPMLRLYDWHRSEILDLARVLDRYLQQAPDPLDPNLLVGVLDIPDERLSVFERAFRATLDTATHRVDPWVTSIAWRRLSHVSDGPDRHYRLGVYGWLDGPFDGSPGPNSAGLLHAPSQPQAITSVILRDKFLSTEHELGGPGSPNPWAMNLDSTHVRTAVELRDDVRLGSHLYEVLGRWVEEIIGTRDGVKQIRALCPLLGPDAGQPQVVCDGYAALHKLLDPPIGAEGIPYVELLNALSPAQQERLVLLKESLDTYADLLVADAVQQVVTGHADLAGELMDAAAGLGRPPTLEFTQTPPSGFQVANTVLAAFPAVPLIDDPTLTPVEIAEPSLALFVEEACGSAADWRWTVGEDDAAAPVASLADLGLQPLEIASVGEDLLKTAVEAKTGIPAGTLRSPSQFQLMRQLLAAFGNQPATTNDLPGASARSAEERRTIDGQIRANLNARYARLQLVCQGDIGALIGATTDVARVAALRRALAWGVVSGSAPADHAIVLSSLVSGTLPEDAETLARLAPAAAEALQRRLDAAPVSTADLSIAQLARAIAELASPDGKLSILTPWSSTDFRELSTLDLVTAAPELETEWMTTVAPVRPTLARLESLQLEAELLDSFVPLSGRSNSAGDPWLTGEIAALQQAREAGSAAQLTTPHFVAAFGPDDAWQSATIAAGLIDSFSEAIPMPQRSTYAAFGFNAPSARAPQAILLAVPPRPKQRLEGEGLFQIVRETRTLAHARAARSEDLGELQLLASNVWLHGSGLERMRLDSATTWIP